MVDINTITVSGTVVGEVDTSSKGDLNIARFQLALITADEAAEPSQFKVVAFGDNAKFCEQTLKEGDPIVVLGRLQSRRWAKRQEVEIMARTIIRIGKREKEAATSSIETR